MTKTGLEFGILVIVICLEFVICYLEFLVILSTRKKLATFTGNLGLAGL